MNNLAYQQHLTHQGYGTSYHPTAYADERGNYVYHQGMSPWNDSATNANPLREALSTTIQLNDQLPGSSGVKLDKLMFEAPPLLEEFNVKNIVMCLKGLINVDRRARTFQCRNGTPSRIGKEYAEFLRQTHNGYQNTVIQQEDMQMSHDTVGWDNQQWQWGWGAQGHGDQLGASTLGHYSTSVNHGSGYDGPPAL